MQQHDALLSETTHALGILYGPSAASASRPERRRAEKALLALRKANPNAAMHVATTLLSSPDPAYALAMSQTIAHLCRSSMPESTWADALLHVLQAAADGGRARPVLTGLSLAICALIARKHAWPAPELVGAVCRGLGAHPQASSTRIAAALLLLSLLPEELESERLALDEIHVEELRAELVGAAGTIVELCAIPLQQGSAHAPLVPASLTCLAAWVRAGLLPWPVLSPAMQPALDVTAAALTAPAATAAPAGDGGVEAARIAALTEGCALLRAAASAFREPAVAELIIGAAMSLQPGFAQVCAQAAEATASGGVLGGSAHAATSAITAAGALASLFAEVGGSYRAQVGKHGALLELLLGCAAHHSAEVAVPALSFWSRSGHSVLRLHPPATRPLLAALLAACQYPADFAQRDGLQWEQKEEVRTASRRVCRHAFLGAQADDADDDADDYDDDGGDEGVRDDGNHEAALPTASSSEAAGGASALPPAAVEAVAWLAETAAAEAALVTSQPDPLGLPAGAAPPSPPPDSDGLPWQRLEAALHLLGVFATGLTEASTSSAAPASQAAAAAAAAAAATAAIMQAPAMMSLVPALASLPARRALWREAATCAGELALALDPRDPNAPMLLVACCGAAARTLTVAECTDDDGDEPYVFTAPGGGDEGATSLHAGARALWRMCAGSRAIAVKLAQHPSIFDGVLGACHACADDAPEQRAKGRLLLQASCALATESADGLADGRIQLICAPMLAGLRAAAGLPSASSPGGMAAAGGTAEASSRAATASAALDQLSCVARHAGTVRPGVLGVIAGEWDAIQALVRTFGRGASADDGVGARVVASACALLCEALRRCEGTVRELLEAAAQLCMELLHARPATGAQRPLPCALHPLTAALQRTYPGASAPPGGALPQGALTGQGPVAAQAGPRAVTASALVVDASLEAGLIGWTEAALGAVLPSLAAPTVPTGDGSDAAPVDLTDDDDEALAATCDVLSACVGSQSPRLVNLACAASLGLLCGPSAPATRATQREACLSSLELASHLFASKAPAVRQLLTDGGGGPKLTLALLNAAGGGMPSYVHDAVTAACRVLFTSQPDVASSWVQAATSSPHFFHPRVTGSDATVPTGGNRMSSLQNYAMVLGYLASHGAWAHFQTVLTRGVAVSEAEDADDDQ